jgi:outer membrane biosynthesis protein TonB
VLQKVLHTEDRPRFGRVGMSKPMRRGLIASALAHVLVLGAVLFGLPRLQTDEPPPEEQTVAMVFEAPAETSVRAPTPSPTPAPAQEVAPPAPATTQAPKPQPTEATTDPPRASRPKPCSRSGRQPRLPPLPKVAPYRWPAG